MSPEEEVPMNDQIAIPCVVMRGGTSRGPFFLASDLPADPRLRDALLLSVMGGGHDLGIDGIGGGNAVVNKVAIVGPASVPGADVDYLFAQVRIREGIVDTSPNCGNMLAAVGPFAIEAGLVAATGDRTHVRIHNVNTAKLIDATVATPGGRVTYEGDAQIDGVPGRAAPIELSFPNASGARTGRLLPTGRPIDVIDGIDVTCIDAAMPVMLIRAADLGWTGREAPSAFAEPSFRARLEALRIEAGRRMGFPDPASMVIPKPILIARATNATLNTRYFMPHDCHSALAVTGAVAIATACVTSGTLATETAGRLDLPASVTLAHPTGHLVVRLEPGPVAQVQRTARRIFEGMVFARRSQVPREAVLAA
jgi:2-methylaconitate cis-trans-isomerase PrpF